MISKKSLFIGNNFLDSQLLYAIPIIHGYCQTNRIKRLIFERPLVDGIINQNQINQILSNYDVVVVRGYSRFRLIRIINFIVNAIKVCLPAFFLAKDVTRESLLKDESWFKCQLKHAVFDQALQRVKDGKLDLSFAARMIAAIRVLIAVSKANYLIKKEGVIAAFLGHSVYAGRALMAQLKLKHIDVVAHAINVFYRIPEEKDASWSLLKRSEWDFILDDLNDHKIKEFWKRRCVGDSNYADASLAAKKSKKVTAYTPKNAILLHVFRDSPFNHIDRKRIFTDYVEWIAETLTIIAKSDEEWLIKTHPSALRWGENQQVWLNAICKKIFNNVWPTNIKLDNSHYSNMDLFAHINRIVTYHGTSHLESACWGIRPIVISDATIGSYESRLNLKPDTFNDYESLLLKSSNLSTFRLSESDQFIARKILYIREEILCFTKEVGSILTYRGDAQEVHKKDFDSVVNKINSCMPALIKGGEAMSIGLSRTVAIKYMDRWCQRVEL